MSLIDDHDEQLGRLRMLWRRGGGPYRPLIPADVQLEELMEEEWDELELDATHFEWIPEVDQPRDARRRRIQQIVAKLWEQAEIWTGTRGIWCDFQLVGSAADGEVLFEVGKRCRVSDCADEHDERPAPTGWPASRYSRQEIDTRVDARLEQLIGRLVDERDRSAANARESLDAAKEAIEATPQLFSQAREVLRETIDYQREQFEHLRDQRSGRYEAQAKVLAEMEKTKRSRDVVELIKHGWESTLGNLIPLADRFIEAMNNRSGAVFPEFSCAQQAMGYLVLTITPHQLTLMWNGKDGAGRAMMALLDKASHIDNEREALETMAPIIRALRDDKFRDVATPEQQLAARYIIGRFALYRLAEYGEVDEHEQAQSV